MAIAQTNCRSCAGERNNRLKAGNTAINGIKFAEPPSESIGLRAEAEIRNSQSPKSANPQLRGERQKQR